MFEVKNLSTGYNNKLIIDSISFNINQGELLCIIGPNGCGKSTLLKALNNINNYTGEVIYKGNNLKTVTNKQLGNIMGMLSQNKSAYFSYSIQDAVAMGNYASSNSFFSVKAQDSKVDEVLKKVDLINERHQRIDQISGGQYQRTMIARLMLQNPEIIMLDEPTNHLDLKHQVEVLEHIKNLVKNDNKIGIVVLHDLNMVQSFADKVILLDLHNNFYIGTPKDILTNSNINKVYGLDVKKWMTDLLKLWE